MGHPRERRLQDRPVRDGRPRDLDRHRLDEGHHGRLVDEAHLEVELGELGLAVAAQVLVAVAARDLHVAVDPGDHQELLELLRALRQRIDRARLEPRRHDEVACALGGALDEGRRLDLDEAVGVVDLADRLDHPAAEHQAALHRLAPDVEVAVLEPDALVDRGVGLVDVERRGLGLGQDLDLGRLEFDGARRELRVLRAGEPWRDGSRDRDDELGSDPACLFVGRGGVRLVDDDLGDPVPIAQVEEDQLAVVTAAVDPAREARGRSRIADPELAAGMGPVGRGEARVGVAHGRRIVAAGPGPGATASFSTRRASGRRRASARPGTAAVRRARTRRR